MTIDLRLALAMLLLACAAHAEDDLQNRGHDPFFRFPPASPTALSLPARASPKPNGSATHTTASSTATIAG
ncbi:hypothetical protein ACPBLO_24745, partial [Escherichia coli]|uniref:hypothetical protein n=1 Tax=Escherichia coli TaxID=562 RepID=UPI003C18A7EC